ncbi:NADP-dependent oxidoreductase domain-containing protein [Collybia nuda]|uniref:NADP-dependent oxidoreductase domain-containing protein n=1 Tax=Collybia nuda TaxID=64659 RepID=A0A9P5Y3K6_9AGAR|nr:NADP-dependent oxidoreductase domain-containing protein [Collybia nuda]
MYNVHSFGTPESPMAPYTQPQSESHKVETFRLGPFMPPRIWTGLWQLSSNAWGSASVAKIRQGMARHLQHGYTTFADHYGSAEIIFGQFRGSLPASEQVVGATKWCVFKRIVPSRAVVLAAVQERMERMGTNKVDLLQFHWNDYSDKGYLTALDILQDLKSEGLISAVGLCNFDTIRTDEICTQLGPGAIVSNQVQFSIIDTRPLHGMSDVCEKHDLKLLTYGTLCGGFLADKWMGKPEPDLYSGNLTPSQRKYLDMIVKVWGTWELFQSLLATLRVIGDRHGGLSIANIATRWVLDHPFVGAVIIGARLGLSEHPDDNHRVFGFKLSEQDNSDIEAVLMHSDGRRTITTIGDCGAEYR